MGLKWDMGAPPSALTIQNCTWSLGHWFESPLLQLSWYCGNLTASVMYDARSHERRRTSIHISRREIGEGVGCYCSNKSHRDFGGKLSSTYSEDSRARARARCSITSEQCREGAHRALCGTESTCKGAAPTRSQISRQAYLPGLLLLVAIFGCSRAGSTGSGILTSIERSLEAALVEQFKPDSVFVVGPSGGTAHDDHGYMRSQMFRIVVGNRQLIDVFVNLTNTLEVAMKKEGAHIRSHSAAGPVATDNDRSVSMHCSYMYSVGNVGGAIVVVAVLSFGEVVAVVFVSEQD